ncbi:MAG TPA: CHRD domain-containing protein [Steroidobacteraceae bacterium]|nr:CHRD domain-containing protein [Steroidobacteraceae bacterium]
MNRFFTSQSAGALVALAFFLAIGSPVHSADIKVTLSGAEETPPVMTKASGVAMITIGADMSVSGTIKTTGIEATMAHVHVGAVGESGPPIITLAKDANGVWVIPAGSKLTDEQYAKFKAGLLYVNVHSADHKPGEIRAQLKP